MDIPYTPPSHHADGFNCPFCNAFARQEWGLPPRIVGGMNHGVSDAFSICRCSRCEKFSVWIENSMVYPSSLTAPKPNPDLPGEVAQDFEEARQIANRSPRGATALLRLCIQKTCRHLGEPGKNINDDIAALVKKGLPIQVQQALDIVRVVGNNAVHPGQLDLKDDNQTATKLFGLVNLIAEIMISQPKQVKELYESVVPASARKAIKDRDS